jgi:hypothetical protein
VRRWGKGLPPVPLLERGGEVALKLDASLPSSVACTPGCLSSSLASVCLPTSSLLSNLA